MRELAVINAGELVTCSGPTGSKDDSSLGIIEDGAFVVRNGRIAWVGSTKQYKSRAGGKAERVLDARGRLVTPGLVDPHTHLAYAGSREDELERKVSGESYTSILKSGGGIVRTIRETRTAGLARLVQESLGRLRQLVANGVTTVEVKTGYGGSLKDEVKMLQAIGALNEAGSAEVLSTFLGLHAKPPEFKRGGDYVRHVIRDMLPAIARSVWRPSFSDCFCEEGVFTREECLRYLRASAELGLSRKIHADEFRDSGGASLSARMGCVSADHLGNSNRDGLEQMAAKKVTAVLLPMTSQFSGIKYADARGIAEAGCDIALATDLSPNSWVESPQLVMSVACNEMKMTPAQALMGFTGNAARSLGRDDIGRIAVGSSADFAVHRLPNHRFLAYRVGGSYVDYVFRQGKMIHRSGKV